LKAASVTEPFCVAYKALISKSVTLKGHFSHIWDVREKCLELMGKKMIDLVIMKTLQGTGKGKNDHSGIIQYFEDQAGAEVRKKQKKS
jgi:hypothetical protein